MIGALAAFALTASAQATRAAGEICTQMQITKLPPINGWLLHGDSSYANWLGIKYFGKTLREPINVILVDRHSATPQAAVSKLVAECRKAGYGVELGHSSGYRGIINGTEYAQVPHKKHVAFANHDFFKTNNHGRIMGPAPWSGGFIFIGAFSEERPAFAGRLEHVFVSFSAARDDFAGKMNARTQYRVAGTYPLENVLATQAETTADHDGNAVVLVATE
jgi:hypothetical protein